MRTVTFDGHDLSDIVVVEDVRRPLMAETIASTTTVNGMDGVALDSMSLGAVSVYVDVRAFGATKAEMRARLATLASWLHVGGPRALTVSDAPGTHWMAVPVGQVDVDEFVSTGGCTLCFLSPSPAAYSDTATTVDLASGSTFTVGGTYRARPVIRATTTGNFRVDFDGTQTVKVSAPGGASVVVDCEGRFATVNGARKPVSLDSDFVELAPGTHKVTAMSGASSVTIEFKARWL